jgi:hypothetical protein
VVPSTMLDRTGASVKDVLQAELDRLVALPALGGRRGSLARRPPRLVVRPVGRRANLWGRASYRRNEILIVLHPAMTLADARATLLHEMVHLAGHVHHDAAFKHALAEAAREAYGVDISPYERGKYKALDTGLERALRWNAARRWLDEVTPLWMSPFTAWIASAFPGAPAQTSG